MVRPRHADAPHTSRLGPFQRTETAMAGAAVDAEGRQHRARQPDGAVPRDPSQEPEHDRHVQRLAGLLPSQRQMAEAIDAGSWVVSGSWVV